jgi:hypothetical protein
MNNIITCAAIAALMIAAAMDITRSRAASAGRIRFALEREWGGAGP